MLMIPYLKPAKEGETFSGAVEVAHFGSGLMGAVFGSNKFKDGDVITTSEIVKVGYVPTLGHYVETQTKSRYLIKNLGDLDIRPGDLESSFMQLRDNIKANAAEYRPKQWS